MVYKLIWKKEALKDFHGLNVSVKRYALSQLEKLQKSPQLGKSLGNKKGMDLTGYKKLYFYKKQYRIVYCVDEENNEVVVYAIGAREGMAVYKEVIKRLNSEKK